jgi:hypothetical protein
VTRGLPFLICILVELLVAGGLAWLLARRGYGAPADLMTRCCAAAIIGTGVSQPALWMWFAQLEAALGSRWMAVAAAQGMVILAETPFYAAALRGRWRLSLGTSAAANLVFLAASQGLSTLRD